MIEYIKDFSGQVIGSVETLSNGDKIAKDFYKRILGKYDKSTDLTKDFYGRILAKGDATTGLVYQKGKK